MEVRILKKNFRRAMAAVMAAALTFSLAGTAADADAAKKKIKLASKSVTVTVKKTKTVKIKNVKAKKVKKLTVKSASKKIATAKAKGKTAVKVTGKKAGKSTKVKITLKIKGQKKATKLTLKVKVKAAPAKKPTVNPPAPATNAPGQNVPAPATQPPSGGNGTAAPATDAPATEVPVTKPPTEKPTQKPEWTPDPEKKVEDVTLTYGNGEGFMFEKADMVKFEDADNYPEEGIDVRYYDSVTVKYTSDEEITSGDEGWGGKATLSSTDEGLGCTAYTDGLYRRYLNDLPYENGGYTVQYNMKDVGEAGGLLDGYDFEEVGLIDCVSVQLESNTHPYVDSEDQTQKGVNFRLMSIEFKAPEKPVETDAPAVSADPSAKPSAPAVTADPSAEPSAPAVTDAPTPKPTAPAVTLSFKHNLAVGETTKVEVAAEGAEIVETHLAVADTSVAELVGDVLTGKKAHGETTIGGTVDLTVSGKTFTDVPVEEAAIRVFAADELIINVADLEDITLVESETAAIEAAATVELGGKPVTDAALTAKWTIVGSAATINSQSAALKNVVTAETAGTATVYLTVTAVKGDKTVTSLQKKAAITVKKAGEIKLAGGKTSINIGETAGIVLEGVEGTIQNVVWEIVKAKAVEAPVVNAAEGESTPAETAEPTKAPTQAPTKAPTQAPTKAPTQAPTQAPAETVAPTEAPKPVVVGDATVEADEDEPAKAVVTGKEAGTVTVKATVTVKKADDSIRTYVVTGQFEVSKNRLVSLTNANMASQGNLTTASGGWADKGIENADGSVTFYTNAVSSGGGIQFWIDADKKKPVDLSDYKEIRITASQNGTSDKQSVIEPFTSNSSNFWGKKNESGITPGYVMFDKDTPSVQVIDLTKATNANIESVMVKYNGHGKPSASATEDEKKACKASYTIYSIEIVAKD